MTTIAPRRSEWPTLCADKLPTGELDVGSPCHPGVEIRFCRVLVPLDGSVFSFAAMNSARALAAALGAELHALVVVREGDDLTRLRAITAAEVGGVRRGRVSVRHDSDPVHAIAHRAAELGSTVVCLSTRARGRVGRTVFGSVAAELIDRGVPVVAIGPVADRPPWVPRPRSWPAPLSGPVIAYVDGSVHDEEVLGGAAAWAEVLGRTLVVLAVVEDAPAPLTLSRTESRFTPQGDAGRYLDALVGRCGMSPPQIRTVIKRDPLSPASGIRSHLDAEPGGLLVISAEVGAGRHERFARTTASDILRVVSTPTAVVPQ